MAKEIYDVSYEYDFEVSIEIEDNEVTTKILHEINNFFSNASLRLATSGECIRKTVSKMIAREILRLQCSSGMYSSIETVIDAFNKGIEGYYPIDGSYGIKLKSISTDFDPWDLELEVEKKVSE